MTAPLETPPGVTATVTTALDDDPDTWCITVSPDIDNRRPTLEAWLTLEFLSWCVRDLRRASYAIEMMAAAGPPWLNQPGHMLTFHIIGRNTPDRPLTATGFAQRVDDYATRYYVPADNLDEYDLDAEADAA